MPHGEDVLTKCLWCGVAVGSSTTPAVGRPGTAEAEALFSDALSAVVASSRRRAARCGDSVLDTAHLLHGLLESDTAVRTLLGGDGPRTAKLLGYLAQRCIGYGLRWRGTVEESGMAREGADVPRDGGELSNWSPAATYAVAVATDRARERGAPRVEGLDLLAGLAADGSCRAAEVLTTSGVDPDRLSRALDVRGDRGDTPVSG